MRLRIGIPLIGGSNWHGGITYIDAILRAFRTLPDDEQPELWLLADVQHEKTFSLYEYLLPLVNGVIAHCVDVERLNVHGTACIPITDFQETEKYVDFIFPINSDCLPGFAYASWIPDLQHKQLPEFFTDRDIASRDSSINFLVEIADTIVFSSQSEKKYFEDIYTNFGGRVEVIPFYSRFDEDVCSIDPAEVALGYGLADRYVICCNQFWQHKNHDNLFKGLAQTKRPVHIVCTGGQSDYRNENWFPYLQNLMTELGIESRVTLLGFIPRSDQIQLLRQSIGIIQPSFYEGWSTVLEDARGLGKRVLASDIGVHREQAVSNATYFDPRSPSQIASFLDELDASHNAGPDPEVEREARNTVLNLQIAAAKRLLQLANDSVEALAGIRQLHGDKAFKWARYQTAKVIQLRMELYAKQQFIESIPILEPSHSNGNATNDPSENPKLIDVLAQKEAVIADQQNQIKHLSEVCERRRLFSVLFFFVRIKFKRLFDIFRPRLGNLCQYVPRDLTLPGAYSQKSSETPLLSIVTPSFGQARFIERTLCSVLSQQYPKLEYFVQDGGSQDGTQAILQKYTDQLSGWISCSDSGQSEAINLGFSNTTGEIMAWLNSDDLLLPGALATVVDFFNSHPDVDVVYGDRLLIDENDMEIGRWIMPGHDGEVLTWVDYVPQETMFWRRRIWDKAGGRIDESFKFAMDWDLLVRFREAGAKFAHIPIFIGAFRIHSFQKTSAAINEIGHQEMDKIRERILGRIPSCKEIRNAVFPFMLKHLAVDMAYRVKKKLGVRR